MARRTLGPASLSVTRAVIAAHQGENVLVACSGGADSLALATAAVVLARRTGCTVRAAVVDHGLQPGSAEHSRVVAAQLGRLGLPARVLTVRVHSDGAGPEAAARDARYAALAAELHQGERCYLGHTLDDQAESVLLGLARGSGPRSLAGMPAARGHFARPLLGLRRSVTEQSCREYGLTWWSDPHNADQRFTRVRVRHTVLPVLEAELGPGIAEALARTAELAREDADALDALTPLVTGAELDCAELTGLAPALRHRLLRAWLLRRGAEEVSRGHLLAVAALVTDWHGQRWVEVPGLRVLRRAGALVAESSGSATAHG
ncbi:tRNA lysidine(34) synthetase TilS [Micropruina sp.]|uniref:tRNA lysidine(34) synthetase TilS n=1 Tax=Micropruina sp. TaxID=2737536 RepID=UPI0039E6BD75